jgi:hypothetical protein
MTAFALSNNLHYFSGLSGISSGGQVVSGFKPQTSHQRGGSHLFGNACAKDSIQSLLSDRNYFAIHFMCLRNSKEACKI